ncbi:hypothetical protein [Streptomyces rhizosphaericola]|uniref:Uncharacterized protein n=1 Tax=Streptomyces rhizosphaericola TaxID=2564098 RepID=A0ABY2PHK9_9ACTN|nr:hypothetical protein [Streptomyces rhizosphaericola]TGZ10565.1 hypothetical protein E5Z02_09215 [Streptomyces rhizosphaericola]
MGISPELQEISNASDPELVLICAAAAERGAAFCRALGRSDQSEWVDTSLRIVWAAAAGDSTQDDCAQALDELEMESQGDEDDSSRPEFYVAQSVALVGNALAVSLRPSATKAEMAVNTIRSLLSMLDFKIGGEKPVIVQYGDSSPSPGPLVQMEINAEREVLDLLARGAATSAQGKHRTLPANRIQASSSEFSERLTPSIEEFSALSSWEL